MAAELYTKTCRTSPSSDRTCLSADLICISLFSCLIDQICQVEPNASQENETPHHRRDETGAILHMVVFVLDIPFSIYCTFKRLTFSPGSMNTREMSLNWALDEVYTKCIHTLFLGPTEYPLDRVQP